jgi:hypothetical protein
MENVQLHYSVVFLQNIMPHNITGVNFNVSTFITGVTIFMETNAELSLGIIYSMSSFQLSFNHLLAKNWSTTHSSINLLP